MEVSLLMKEGMTMISINLSLIDKEVYFIFVGILCLHHADVVVHESCRFEELAS